MQHATFVHRDAQQTVALNLHGSAARRAVGGVFRGESEDAQGLARRAPTRRQREIAMSPALKSLVVMLLFVSIAAAGCGTLTGKTAGENVDDATITASVKSKLVADKASNLTRVNVDTNRGTVYLNGVVDTPEQKANAEQLAWQAHGVRSVVNNLQVQKR
jgi:hyperosmotically inducible periplasmic protein